MPCAPPQKDEFRRGGAIGRVQAERNAERTMAGSGGAAGVPGTRVPGASHRTWFGRPGLRRDGGGELREPDKIIPGHHFRLCPAGDGKGRSSKVPGLENRGRNEGQDTRGPRVTVP